MVLIPFGKDSATGQSRFANDGDVLANAGNQLLSGGANLSVSPPLIGIAGTESGFIGAQSGYIGAPAGDILETSWGVFGALTGVGTGTAGADTYGCYNSRTTTTSLNTERGVYTNNVGIIYESRPVIIAMIATNTNADTSDPRMFCGLTTNTLSAMVSSSTPSGNFIGINYDGAASNNYQLVVSDGSTQTEVDANITGVTTQNPLMLVIDVNAANEIIITAYNGSNKTVAATNTFSSNLPSSTTKFRFVCGMENTAAFSTEMQFYYAKIGLRLSGA